MMRSPFDKRARESGSITFVRGWVVIVKGDACTLISIILGEDEPEAGAIPRSRMSKCPFVGPAVVSNAIATGVLIVQLIPWSDALAIMFGVEKLGEVN